MQSYQEPESPMYNNVKYRICSDVIKLIARLHDDVGVFHGDNHEKNILFKVTNAEGLTFRLHDFGRSEYMNRAKHQSVATDMARLCAVCVSILLWKKEGKPSIDTTISYRPEDVKMINFRMPGMMDVLNAPVNNPEMTVHEFWVLMEEFRRSAGRKPLVTKFILRPNPS